MGAAVTELRPVHDGVVAHHDLPPVVELERGDGRLYDKGVGDLGLRPVFVAIFRHPVSIGHQDFKLAFMRSPYLRRTRSGHNVSVANHR